LLCAVTDSYRKQVALLTGASGFIGGHLRDSLLKDGYDVVALTRPGSPEPKKGRAIGVDYASPESVERAIEQERPELIFHVAGATKGVSYDDFQRGNVMPTQALLDAVRKKHAGLQRFVHISSLTAYGPSTPDAPKQEHHERKPVEHYGKSKLEAELAIEGMGDVPWTIVRPPGVYGPADVDNFELFKLAVRGLNVFYGNRYRHLSLIHVDDLVRGIREAAVHSGTIGKGYFLTDGQPLTWDQYQARICAATGKKPMLLNLPEFTTDIAAMFGELATSFDKKPRLFNRQKVIMGKQEAWTCTHDQAQADFGFTPRVALDDGIQNTLEWYRKERWV
jgi:nucleoside-diphosphate-sugar epimerase